MRLLTPSHANAKMSKNDTVGGYLSFILHLAPYKLSGINVCPKASHGCAAACLNTAGRGRFNSIQEARLKKTRRFIDSRSEFMADLVKDLQSVERKALKTGFKPVVRLNGTSDLDWTLIKTDNGQSIIERFPKVQFYDYTKDIKRLVRLRFNPIDNYHVTFSRSETNDVDCLTALSLGYNVAVVFKSIPNKFWNRRIINGDAHDLRFLDAKEPLGLIVGLLAKGKAKKDKSGFVLDVSNERIAA